MRVISEHLKGIEAKIRDKETMEAMREERKETRGKTWGMVIELPGGAGAGAGVWAVGLRTSSSALRSFLSSAWTKM